jgi:hypothetical protein
MRVDWHPGRAQLRSFGLVYAAVSAGLGTWAFLHHRVLGLDLAPDTSAWVATGLWGMAAGSAVVAALAPRALRPLYCGLTAITLPIGYVVSHAVMTLVFFAVLTPIAVVFRLVGRDPLRRRWERTRGTYWEPRGASGDVRRYYRQF